MESLEIWKIPVFCVKYTILGSTCGVKLLHVPTKCHFGGINGEELDIRINIQGIEMQ